MEFVVVSGNLKSYTAPRPASSPGAIGIAYSSAYRSAVIPFAPRIVHQIAHVMYKYIEFVLVHM